MCRRNKIGRAVVMAFSGNLILGLLQKRGSGDIENRLGRKQHESKDVLFSSERLALSAQIQPGSMIPLKEGGPLVSDSCGQPAALWTRLCSSLNRGKFLFNSSVSVGAHF
jgi:hypothetical protein